MVFGHARRHSGQHGALRPSACTAVLGSFGKHSPHNLHEHQRHVGHNQRKDGGAATRGGARDGECAPVRAREYVAAGRSVLGVADGTAARRQEGRLELPQDLDEMQRRRDLSSAFKRYRLFIIQPGPQPACSALSYVDLSFTVKYGVLRIRVWVSPASILNSA